MEENENSALIADFHLHHMLSFLIAMDEEHHDSILMDYIRNNHMLPEGYEHCITEEMYLKVPEFIGAEDFYKLEQTPIMVITFLELYGVYLSTDDFKLMIKYFVTIKDDPEIVKLADRVGVVGVQQSIKEFKSNLPRT